MIIIRLKGGLGNQMFQYALGRALQIKNHLVDGQLPELKLDTTGLENAKQFKNVENVGSDTPRSFGLDVFNIKASLAKKEEVARKRTLLFRIINRLKMKFVNMYGIDHQALQVKDDAYLEGFWQSECYFANVAEKIREDFTLKVQLGSKAHEWENKVLSTNQQNTQSTSEMQSISLHIRRGDYVQDTKARTYFNACNISYYELAYKKILEELRKQPNISHPSTIIVYVFSDDIAWARENLKLPCSMEFVSNDKKNLASDVSKIEDYEELYLMSQCHHHIIANSSFSWWGAWLDQKHDKIVVAPKHWVADPKIDTSLIIPERWIKI